MPRIKTDGLVLYVPMYRTSLNTSPFISADTNHHSCAVTGATWGSQGRRFDGTDDYITIPYNSILQPSGAASWVFWIFPTANTQETIINKGISAGDPDYIIQYARAGTTEALSVYNGTAWVDSTNNILATNLWQHLALVWNGAAISVYVQGIYKEDLVCTSMQSSVNDVSIGRQGGTTRSGNYYSGIIGEVWIYSRALSLSEVQSHRLETMWRYH